MNLKFETLLNLKCGTHFLVFLRHLSYCPNKAFHEAYDKMNEFSNFKYNLVSRFDKLQGTATELGSKDTF